MADSDCEDGRLKAQDAAAEFYQLAALMLGDESQAVDLVEAAVSVTDIDPCEAGEASIRAARLNLVESAVARLSKANPSIFEAPTLSGEGSGGCIEGDDLSSAGITSNQLAEMVNGAGRRSLRNWLNQLPVAQRVIFVERAILGWDNDAAATSISRASAHSWQPRQVSDLFRQALCSLTTSLLHSAAVRV